MSSTHLESGRVNQKLRTRQALLQAAQALLDAGGHPTVAEVAGAARVSTATAYRYFPSRETLLLEAVLDRRVASPEVVVPDAVRDPAERAACVQRYLYDLTADHEASFRLFLAGTMQEWVRSEGAPTATLRGGRRLGMLERALAPLRDRLTPAVYDLLAQALAGMTGMETYFALADVCHLKRARATRVMGWAVETLVRAVAAGAGGPGAGRSDEAVGSAKRGRNGATSSGSSRSGSAARRSRGTGSDPQP